jgi:hypothetical protein
MITGAWLRTSAHQLAKKEKKKILFLYLLCFCQPWSKLCIINLWVRQAYCTLFLHLLFSLYFSSFPSVYVNLITCLFILSGQWKLYVFMVYKVMFDIFIHCVSTSFKPVYIYEVLVFYIHRISVAKRAKFCQKIASKSHQMSYDTCISLHALKNVFHGWRGGGGTNNVCTCK